MSRLDRAFLAHFAFASWRAAFTSVGSNLGIPSASVKNLRDEFDPVHSNPRQGWHGRPLRANRQRILGEFCDTSDGALLEIVERILARDPEIAESISEPLALRNERVENVAERLRTGRLAEEYFLERWRQILSIPNAEIVDVRTHACGYDFALSDQSNVAIEVKGMKETRGSILFTDREWNEAIRRQGSYWLVVVGSIERSPQHLLLANPTARLRGKTVLRTATVVSWRASITFH